MTKASEPMSGKPRNHKLQQNDCHTTSDSTSPTATSPTKKLHSLASVLYA